VIVTWRVVEETLHSGIIADDGERQPGFPARRLTWTRKP